MRPRVSVVIPVFNRSQSILPTLTSVQHQSMCDFECLVIDDGSADGDRLKEVVSGLEDSRFRCIRRNNGGGSAARNMGIDEACGEIIAFLDSDDRWLPDKLERDIAEGAGRRVVYSPMLVERAGRIRGQRPRRGPRPGEAISEYLACHQGFVPSSTLSLPLELARRVKYDEQIAFGDDTDFAIRLAAAGAQFHMHPMALAVMSDDESAKRLSRSTDWRAALAWTEKIRPLISDRAYYAIRGWHVARLAAGEAQYGAALRFYLSALVRGALPPALGAKAIAQILVPRHVYKR